MKLYLAGPMTGYTDDNRPRFNNYAALLRLRGYSVVNPAEFNQDQPYDALLREGLLALRGCNAVATHGKWRASYGAQGEVFAARSLRMPVRPWWYWDLFNWLWAKHTPV